MIKAVVFDMFETLVSLFEGRTYFSEHMAADLGLEHERFREAWHVTEKGRSCGVYTIEEGVEKALRLIDHYGKDSVTLLAGKRREALSDTFRVVPDDSLRLLAGLKERGLLIGLISNCYDDERDFIRNSPMYPYFDVTMLSYEQGVCKPDPEIFRRMIRSLKVKPEKCLYVGDGGSHELYAASDMGMKAVQTLVFHEMA